MSLNPDPRYRRTPAPIVKPRPPWYLRALCALLTHDLVPSRGGSTARCLRCKETWP